MWQSEKQVATSHVTMQHSRYKLVDINLLT